VKSSAGDAPAHEVPVIGVVIPAYQAELFIAQAIDSVLQQGFRAWHCVVVNDGSTDNTAAVVEAAVGQDQRIHLCNQTHAGVGSARNAGLAALPPGVKYVCFLDSDDLLVADGLETLANALSDRPDAVAATGWADTIDTQGRPIELGRHRVTQSARLVGQGLRVRTLGLGEDTTFASLAVYGTIWPPATALLRRDVIVAVGGFDETLSSQEDWDLFLNASRRGPIVFVDRQVAWYRRHGNNATRDLVTNRYCADLVRYKAWVCPDNTREQRRVLVLASLRLRSWEVVREVRAAIGALRARRPKRFAVHGRRLAYSFWQLARICPTLPNRDRIEQMVALEDDAGAAGGMPRSAGL
jgi:glycosyltransferase involved in cell wall biosynthesis